MDVDSGVRQGIIADQAANAEQPISASLTLKYAERSTITCDFAFRISG
jgi:hypothetical protein